MIDTTKELLHKDISRDLIKIGLFEHCDESEESKVYLDTQIRFLVYENPNHLF